MKKKVMTSSVSSLRRGFTLVEMMVVVAIIGILIGVLLPAFSVVRTSAKQAQCKAQYGALDAGLEAFRGESALGSDYPPSASDNPLPNSQYNIIADPASEDRSNTVLTNGAHLLLQAMLGADLLGPPGFKDTNRNGQWWDDTNQRDASSNIPSGVYKIDDTTGDLAWPRYGGTGGFVDDKMRARAKSFEQLELEGVIAQHDTAIPKPYGGAGIDASKKQLLFVDPWDRPILYYKANRAARRITSPNDDDQPGIYDQRDNAYITGSDAENAVLAGIDFGPGGDPRHAIKLTDATPPLLPPPTPRDPSYVDTLAQFVHDPSIKQLNQPVRKDTYLFISAGPDARYGTADDITNWDREVE